VAIVSSVFRLWGGVYQLGDSRSEPITNASNGPAFPVQVTRRNLKAATPARRLYCKPIARTVGSEIRMKRSPRSRDSRSHIARISFIERDLVRHPKLFKEPKDSLRTRLIEMMDDDHLPLGLGPYRAGNCYRGPTV
jgi:hypothetical protein